MIWRHWAALSLSSGGGEGALSDGVVGVVGTGDMASFGGGVEWQRRRWDR